MCWHNGCYYVNKLTVNHSIYLRLTVTFEVSVVIKTDILNLRTMKNKPSQKDFNGFATFKELLAWLKRTPAIIVDLTSQSKRFQN